MVTIVMVTRMMSIQVKAVHWIGIMGCIIIILSNLMVDRVEPSSQIQAVNKINIITIFLKINKMVELLSHPLLEEARVWT